MVSYGNCSTTSNECDRPDSQSLIADKVIITGTLAPDTQARDFNACSITWSNIPRHYGGKA